MKPEHYQSVNETTALSSFKELYFSFKPLNSTYCIDLLVAIQFADGTALFHAAENAFVPSHLQIPSECAVSCRPAAVEVLDPSDIAGICVRKPKNCNGKEIQQIRVFALHTGKTSTATQGRITLSTDRREKIIADVVFPAASTAVVEIFRIASDFIATSVSRVDLQVPEDDFYVPLLGVPKPQAFTLDAVSRTAETVSVSAHETVPLATHTTLQQAPVVPQPNITKTPISQELPTLPTLPGMPEVAATPVAKPVSAPTTPAVPDLSLPTVPGMTPATPAVHEKPAAPVNPNIPSTSAAVSATPAAPVAAPSALTPGEIRPSSRFALVRGKLFSFNPVTPSVVGLVEMVGSTHLNCELGIYLRKDDGNSAVFFTSISRPGSFEESPFISVVEDINTSMTKHILINFKSLQQYPAVVFFARSLDGDQDWSADGIAFRFITDSVHEPFSFIPAAGVVSPILRLGKLVVGADGAYQIESAAYACEKFVDLDHGL